MSIGIFTGDEIVSAGRSDYRLPVTHI